ncbi:hypothetical protein [Flavobacterium phage FPSV-S29]|nr:hypothetical protein [Flavobacterium phage FPSV-S29]
MKSHFIKDTNEQYSIREDGVVINNKTGRILSINNNKCNGYINNKTFSFYIPYLLKEYFNTITCNNKYCKNIVSDKSKQKCITCLKETKNACYLKIRTKARNNINKSYIANSILNISVDNISDELYEEYKQIIKIKRLISKKFNINIQQL